MQTQSAGAHTLHPTASDTLIQRANGELARQHKWPEQWNSAITLIKASNNGAHLFLWEPIKEGGRFRAHVRIIHHLCHSVKRRGPNGRPPGANNPQRSRAPSVRGKTPEELVFIFLNFGPLPFREPIFVTFGCRLLWQILRKQERGSRLLPAC